MKRYRAATFVQFTPPDGPGACGMLIDERESLLIELNGTACAAWDVLVEPSDEAVQAYIERVGIPRDDATQEIEAFAEKLRLQGWIEPVEGTAG
jgi:Coenzyme PQQ synthesis protein D (PqqD)